jgi:hypothetical protein
MEDRRGDGQQDHKHSQKDVPSLPLHQFEEDRVAERDEQAKKNDDPREPP